MFISVQITFRIVGNTEELFDCERDGFGFDSNSITLNCKERARNEERSIYRYIILSIGNCNMFKKKYLGFFSCFRVEQINNIGTVSIGHLILRHLILCFPIFETFRTLRVAELKALRLSAQLSYYEWKSNP